LQHTVARLLLAAICADHGISIDETLAHAPREERRQRRADAIAGDGATILTHRRDARGDVGAGDLAKLQPVQRLRVFQKMPFHIGVGAWPQLGLLERKIVVGDSLERLCRPYLGFSLVAGWILAELHTRMKVYGAGDLALVVLVSISRLIERDCVR